MIKETSRVVFSLLMLLLLLWAGSCKKEASPSVSGSINVDCIAVLPLPEIDIDEAQRIMRQGAISPTAGSSKLDIAPSNTYVNSPASVTDLTNISVAAAADTSADPNRSP